MGLRKTSFFAIFTLMVMLFGFAHVMQHDLAHDAEHYGEHVEKFYEHDCLQADISGAQAVSAAILPPAFLTNAPHLPRTSAPHQARLIIYPARGPPLLL